MKNTPTMSSRAKRGICFLFVFNKKQQMPRCARHDKGLFSSACLVFILLPLHFIRLYRSMRATSANIERDLRSLMCERLERIDRPGWRRFFLALLGLAVSF